MITDIDFVCAADERNRERQGYWRAFRRFGNLTVRSGCRSAIGSGPVLERAGTLVLYPDPPHCAIPGDLASSPSPTACFQIDTYSKPQWRALWSCLFDYVFVFHPGFEHHFRTLGHPRVILLPHAVERPAVTTEGPVRQFEIGWVGSLGPPYYASRRRILPVLANRFQMNAWSRPYDPGDVGAVYGQSKIVVNIGRDDYPGDANLRCFEAMGAGALLVTRLPSELSEMGFAADRHFVGYRHEAELVDLLEYYLKNDGIRRAIAESARQEVLSHHTYDARARQILSAVRADGGKHFAPARSWTPQRREYVYLHYFCKRLMLTEAVAQLHRLAGHSVWYAARGFPHLMRCIWHTVRRRIQRRQTEA